MVTGAAGRLADLGGNRWPAIPQCVTLCKVPVYPLSAAASFLLGLSLKVAAIDSQFRHELDIRRENAVCGPGVVAIRLKPLDQHDLFVDALLSLRNMIASLVQLLDKRLHPCAPGRLESCLHSGMRTGHGKRRVDDRQLKARK